MKKFNSTYSGFRGCLPYQLRQKLVGKDLSRATQDFVSWVNDIAVDFHSKINPWMTFSDISRVQLSAPDIFGLPVNLSYIDSGMSGSVYKINIGGHNFALKINRVCRVSTCDLENMHLYSRMRNFINRPHIGAVFKNHGAEYTWILTDYIDKDINNGFELARNKVFFMSLLKGITCDDFNKSNVKNGKLIDLDALSKLNLLYNLSAADKEVLQRVALFMRRGQDLNLHQTLRMVALRYPNVVCHLFLCLNMENVPVDFGRYKNILAAVIQEKYRENIVLKKN